MFKLGLEKAEEPDYQPITNICWVLEKSWELK